MSSNLAIEAIQLINRMTDSEHICPVWVIGLRVPKPTKDSWRTFF